MRLCMPLEPSRVLPTIRSSPVEAVLCHQEFELFCA